MHALEDNVLGKVLQKLQNILYFGLERQSPETDAISWRATCDHMLERCLPWTMDDNYKWLA